MFSAIDFVSANAMFDITAITIPRTGNVMRDVVPRVVPGPGLEQQLALREVVQMQTRRP
jgi:hypothetical protein